MATTGERRESSAPEVAMTHRAEADVAPIVIGERVVGPGHPAFVIAELSANHGQSLAKALELVAAAAAAGADAVKLQTYTPATMTLDVDLPAFQVGPGSPWAGRRLSDLYAEAMTPWEWYGQLRAAAADAGMELFSTPFDRTAVEFLAEHDAPAYKIASFELTDLPLIAYAAERGRPLIISTGMGTDTEIDAAVTTATHAGAPGVVLLRCNSAYPARPEEMDLRTIGDMRARWSVPIGLSDHTLGLTAVTAAIALGACVVEKHLTARRDEPGPDSSFSLEPTEFETMVATVRETEAALGCVRYGPSPSESSSLAFRRSLWVTSRVPAGAVIGPDDVRALRPAGGLGPSDIDRVLGRRAARDLEVGTPVSWDLLADD
jgi:N-acetylneuraminate synthase